MRECCLPRCRHDATLLPICYERALIDKRVTKRYSGAAFIYANDVADIFCHLMPLIRSGALHGAQRQ